VADADQRLLAVVCVFSDRHELDVGEARAGRRAGSYHHVCKSLLRAFEARQNAKSHVWFRWFNEIPVIVLLVVVLLVVLKPF